MRNTLKNALLTGAMLGMLTIPVAAQQLNCSTTRSNCTLKDNNGKSYKVRISPTTTPEPTPAPVEPDHTHEPVPVPQPEPTPVPTPTPTPTPLPDTTGSATPPLSWDSPVFANMTTSGGGQVSSGTTMLNKTITVHNEPASVTMGNRSTLDKVRIGGASREAVRIGGGTYTILNSWLEAKGQGDDHADVIQTYAGPGGGGPLDLTIRNSTIKAYNQAATAGLFVADKIWGKVTLDNVVFWGGPFGLALYADVNTLELYAKDVCFVGPFGYRPYSFRNAGGQFIVKQWDNVNNCTIQNGKLVRGTAIPRP